MSKSKVNQLTMELYQSPQRDQNEERYGSDGCICCMKPMKENEDLWVHMNQNWVAVHPNVTEENCLELTGSESQGCFPIGSSCAKKMTGFVTTKGWNCVPWDIKNERDVLEIEDAETALEIFEDVDGVIAFPPCDHFAGCGAQYWKKKDASGLTEDGMELVRQVLRFTDLFYPTDTDFDGTFFWVMENPVGRLNKLFPELGKPYIFDPCDFAGYLKLTNSDHNELDRIRMKDGKGVTTEEAQFVMDKNAFTKRTCLWGSFNREMEKKRIEPVRCCPQGSPLQRLGGKTEKTKTIRSQTPEGFALALFKANHNWRPDSWDIENYFNN